ncbi:hypothetical protein [Actinomycetospora sp. NBRC 106375]|uniref:hypothetical protein n=1 Tax=Actinomycetospora sp. NBRC 106375 TaxID=3032207 RepID=UPI002555F6AA|nr:hypothetical protein [Actinomycetospora sp. NBRC 106375]
MGAFVATPLVSIARRGTIDERTTADVREQAARAAMVQRAQRRSAIVASIPAPRRADHDQQRSPLAG